MRLTGRELRHYWAFQEFCNLRSHHDEIIDLPETGDHASVFRKSDETIIAVDATDTDNGLGEWVSNFNFNPPINGFHNGFYTTAEMFYEKLRPLFKELKSYWHRCPVVLQGHSRGGGIAPIIEAMARADGYKDIKTVTFAAPKCANQSGRIKMKRLGCIHHRVEASKDVVDNVPPVITFRPFSIWTHYDTEHYQLPPVRGIDHKEIGLALKEFKDE